MLWLRACTPARLGAVVVSGSLALALLQACELIPTDELLANKACTAQGECVAGYACDKDSQRCVPSATDVGGSGAGGSGAAAAGGAGGAGAGAGGVGGEGGQGGEGAHTCGRDPEPVGGECPDVCTNGCDDGTCRIDCEGNNKCNGARIECPEGFDCSVSCAGSNACREAVIACSSDNACQVTCSSGCSGADIECGAGVCELVCGPGGACSNVALHCDSDTCRATCEETSSAPVVECGRACECAPC